MFSRGPLISAKQIERPYFSRETIYFSDKMRANFSKYWSPGLICWTIFVGQNLGNRTPSKHCSKISARPVQIKKGRGNQPNKLSLIKPKRTRELKGTTDHCVQLAAYLSSNMFSSCEALYCVARDVGAHIQKKKKE